jgi:hypothetical protein
MEIDGMISFELNFPLKNVRTCVVCAYGWYRWFVFSVADGTRLSILDVL